MPGPSKARNNYLIQTRGAADPRLAYNPAIAMQSGYTPTNVSPAIRQAYTALGLPAPEPAPAPAPLAPLPQLTLETDPSYLTYLRSIGLREEDARATAARQISRVQRDVAGAVPDIQEQGVEARRGIGDGFEARGVFRSGERLRDQALQQRDETKRIAGVYQQGADSESDLNFQRDQTISALSRERAERAADTQASITQQNAYNQQQRRLGLL